MRVFSALVIKELRLLWRDRAGLLLLFLMPVVLVMVITLVQQNVLKIAGESGARVVVIDHDRGGVGDDLVEEMRRLGLGADRVDSGADVAGLVRRCRLGEIRALVMIPAGFSRGLELGIRNALKDDREKEKAVPRPEITVTFDPTALAGLRAAVAGVARAVTTRIVARTMAAELERVLPDRIRAALVAAVGPAAALAPVKIPSLAPPDEDMVSIKTETAGAGTVVPTAVQHNVPAWSLFGIFFIVVPMAAVILNERRSNTFARLLSAPVSRFSLVSARILAYTVVCIAQFIILFAVGAYVLPRFGTDALTLPPATVALALTLLAACFAASGYGFLVGVLARTHEQAAMFGSISVVVAAAIGGIMVPVYAMPPLMRAVSAVSPLGWGLEALLALFVRGVGLETVWPQLAALFLFGCCCLAFSWLPIARGRV